jgi:hypothetical protein
MSTAKVRSGLYRAFRFILLACIAIVIIIMTGGYFFIKSTHFTKFVEYIVSRRSAQPVEIGSISYDKEQGIVVQDIAIGKDDERASFFTVPYIAIDIGFFGLLNRHVERITLKNPRLVVTLAGQEGTDTVQPISPPAFSMQKVLIENGEVMLLRDEGKTFRMSALNIVMSASGKTRAEIEGSVFLHALNVTMPIALVVDTERFHIEKGHIDMVVRDIATLPVKKLPLLSEADITGSLSISIDLSEEEIPGVTVNSRFQGLGVTRHGRPFGIEDASGDLFAAFTMSEDYRTIAMSMKGVLYNPAWGEDDRHEISFDGTYDMSEHMLRIKDASLQSSLLGPVEIRGSLENIPSERPTIDLAVTGKAVPLHAMKQVFAGSLPEAVAALHGEGYGSVRSSLTGSLKKPHINADAALIYRNIDIQDAAAGFPELFHEKGITVTGRGTLQASFSATMAESAGFLVQGKADFDVTEGGFSSSDFTKVAEGVTLSLSTDFMFPFPLESMTFTARAHVADFELLWGSFYGSFHEGRHIEITAQGEYKKISDTLLVSQAELGMKELGTILLVAEITDLSGTPKFSADLHLAELSNNFAYDFFIKETFQERFPSLAQMETGGTTSFNLSVQGTSERFGVSGELRVKEMYVLNRKEALSVQGVNLRLPVDISYPEAVPVRDAGLFGSLKVQSVSKADLQIQRLRAFPALWKNALVFRDDIVIPLFGGSVRLGNIMYHDILNPEEGLTFLLSLDDIDFEKVSTTMQMPRFSGKLSGLIPEARLAGGSLRTEGTIAMQLFGGEITVDNLSVKNMFGRVPSIETSIEVKDIDLSKLTSTFEFGHISGIMRGSIRDLVITRGQAERFEAEIKSVKRRGVGQWISVEALKNISILGSGSSTMVLSQGIYQLFKRYRYEKMGFKGSLRNDNLLLLGIEREGRKGYLVKGGALPPRVDVISYTQNISFQDMVKRLKRVRIMDRAKNIQ